MDLISTRTIDIASLGLDGFAAKHKAISSNIANADTPGYKRMDVTFEDQLEKVINKEDYEENQRLLNSSGRNYAMPMNINLNDAMMNISDFEPQVVENTDNSPNEEGNTVNLEQEMSSLTKNGMSYNALTLLQAKEFRTLTEIVKSQV